MSLDHVERLDRLFAAWLSHRLGHAEHAENAEGAPYTENTEHPEPAEAVTRWRRSVLRLTAPGPPSPPRRSTAPRRRDDLRGHSQRLDLPANLLENLRVRLIVVLEPRDAFRELAHVTRRRQIVLARLRAVQQRVRRAGDRRRAADEGAPRDDLQRRQPGYGHT